MRAFCFAMALLVMGGLAACKGRGAEPQPAAADGGNWLIGTWTLSQPSPPVTGQSDKDCVYTKWAYTKVHYQTWAGDKTGGPEVANYVIEGNNIFLTGPYNNITFTLDGPNRMYWSAAYGRCYYVKS